MPEVKIKHIISFSSEEKPHIAENLLRSDTTKKWKCAPGEKQASVVFQLEKSTTISSIDIGNDGSAFVEVLVARSSHDNMKYQVLLVASSFMSPQESRVGTSPNRVRIFNRDKLSPDAAAEKWDTVKVVCTQPFNKRSSYGLSFIKLHSITVKPDPSQQEESSSNEKRTKQFGGFKMKKEDSNLKASSFHPSDQMLMAVKVETSELKNKNTKETSRGSKSPESRELEMKRRKPECKTNPKDSKPIDFGQLKVKNGNSSTVKKHTPPMTQTSKRQASSSSDKKVTKKKGKVAVPYDRLLNGVIFVISGFQNPLRSEIREKALRMGAQYRKDWSQDSTHLVCAFANTPKYRQVAGVGGKIVRKEWLLDCEKKKSLLSWKKYAMNSDVSSSSSEEEETIERQETESDSSSGEQNNDDPYAGSTDEDGDTEDEIEKLQPTATVASTRIKQENPYDASTDDEDASNENQQQSGGLQPLPDYFEHKQFLLYGNLDQAVRRLLTRHIVACGGKISKYMSDDIEYVITEEKWDEEFDRALSKNAALVFVKPSWVFTCGVHQKLLPTHSYLISHA